MITLLTTLLSFLAGGLPKLLGFFQDRADKKHELALAQMQIERELELRKAGFEAQARVEEIRTDQLQVGAEVTWLKPPWPRSKPCMLMILPSGKAQAGG